MTLQYKAGIRNTGDIMINNHYVQDKEFRRDVMAIIVNLDVMMAKRKISLNDLAEKVGITNANLSILKTGKAKAIRFSTLEAICKELKCQPGDILEYKED
jgi:putative transcriptional regulator